MKKLICLLAFLILFSFSTVSVHASTWWESNGEGVLQWAKDHPNDGSYFMGLKASPSSEWAKKGADAGVLSTDEISQLKDMGMLEQSYGTTVTQQPEKPKTELQPPTSTKEESVIVEFSVEVMDTTMWATQNVNVRQGADSTFNKVGSLHKNDEVHVTGKASTGWYEIEKGSLKGYVSGKYLTNTKPNEEVVSVEAMEVIATAPTELMSTEVLSDEPAIVDEIEPVDEPSIVVAEVTSEIESSEEVVAETQEKTPTYFKITLATLAIIIIVIIVWLVYRKRKHKNLTERD